PGGGGLRLIKAIELRHLAVAGIPGIQDVLRRGRAQRGRCCERRRRASAQEGRRKEQPAKAAPTRELLHVPAPPQKFRFSPHPENHPGRRRVKFHWCHVSEMPLKISICSWSRRLE